MHVGIAVALGDGATQHLDHFEVGIEQPGRQQRHLRQKAGDDRIQQQAGHDDHRDRGPDHGRYPAVNLRECRFGKREHAPGVGGDFAIAVPHRHDHVNVVGTADIDGLVVILVLLRDPLRWRLHVGFHLVGMGVIRIAQLRQPERAGAGNLDRDKAADSLAAGLAGRGLQRLLELGGVEQARPLEQVLCLSVKQGDRALRAVGDQATDPVVLGQEHQNAENNSDTEHGHTQPTRQQAINGLLMNSFSPRFLVEMAL